MKEECLRNKGPIMADVTMRSDRVWAGTADVNHHAKYLEVFSTLYSPWSMKPSSRSPSQIRWHAGFFLDRRMEDDVGEAPS